MTIFSQSWCRERAPDVTWLIPGCICLHSPSGRVVTVAWEGFTLESSDQICIYRLTFHPSDFTSHFDVKDRMNNMCNMDGLDITVGMWQLTRFRHFCWHHFWVHDHPKIEVWLVKNVFCASIFKHAVVWNPLCCLVLNVMIFMQHFYVYRRGYDFFFNPNLCDQLTNTYINC